ncbi:MAG: hypothetical protein KF841_15710 [Phycisphaerae bacterium]|nr:hypothetical protein [Phycisphaerae bacterium]
MGDDSPCSTLSRPAPAGRAFVFRAAAVLLVVLAGAGLWHISNLIVAMLTSNVGPIDPDSALRSPRRPDGPRVPPIYVETSRGIRLRRLMDAEIVDPISNRRVRFQTNALGMRGGDVLPKQPGVTRILVLGDSITLGAYVEESETYPALVQESLRRDGSHCEVLNGGLAGAALATELELLLETGLLVQPDVVLVGLFLNDASASAFFAPPEGVLADSPIVQRLTARRLAYDLAEQGQARWERLSGRPFPEKPLDAEAWRTDRATFEFEVASAMSDWGVAWFDWAWDRMGAELEAMKELSAQHGFQLLVALFPVKYQVEAEFVEDTPQRHFAATLGRLSIPACDLLPALREAYRENRARGLIYDHCHLTPAGYEVVAPVLARFVLDRISS